jgi:thiamine pyrophosphokinase
MTHALVVGAAPATGAEVYYRALLGTYDLVVAADAAGEWCASLGRVPGVVIGDFDSSADGAADRLGAAGALVIRLPRDKDVSDLDAAVDAAIDHGATNVTLTAAFTGRIDHTLCAFGSLTHPRGRAGERRGLRAGMDGDGRDVRPTIHRGTRRRHVLLGHVG